MNEQPPAPPHATPVAAIAVRIRQVGEHIVFGVCPSDAPEDSELPELARVPVMLLEADPLKVAKANDKPQLYVDIAQACLAYVNRLADQAGMKLLSDLTPTAPGESFAEKKMRRDARRGRRRGRFNRVH